jgi:hypothetical protein
LPPGWPERPSLNTEALLAPFLACTSPADFIALQERVDMPRLVEALDDWNAVRLGPLGPMREDAAEALNRKRASFLATATREYGPALAEVFALFVLDSSHDDDLHQVLGQLARDKRLGQTLGQMALAREQLLRRGLHLSDYPDRSERLGDAARGAHQGASDLVSSAPLFQVGGALEYEARKRHLPPPYRQALEEVERALVEQALTSDTVALGVLDELTFGIPLGTYHLAAGLAHGVASLSQGQYEQATRELTPALLMVALYAGGKGLRSAARGPGTGRSALPVAELRSRLAEVAAQLEARLGGAALEELARHIRARREAARFVAVGGPEAAVALHETGGHVPRAQAWLSQAKSERPGATRARSSAGKSSASVASLADEAAGLTREVVEAKLLEVELEVPGPRLPRDIAVLEKQRPALEAPPPGAQGHPRWGEYVAYYERRLGEIHQGKAAKGPLPWESYERMWGWFARGLDFERAMVKVLRADAALPRAQRRFLGDFDTPRVETYVGVKKPGTGLRYADVLVLETGPFSGRAPRVETFSFKSRDLSGLEYKALEAQLKADAREALLKYGETLNIRRDSLQPLLRQGGEVPVARVRLIYEGGKLKPTNGNDLNAAVKETKAELPGVEVFFQ